MTCHAGAMRRVLIIEDDSELREELVELATTLGARVVGARNGAEAMAACTGEIDVILCDYKLGVENGLDVLRALREARCFDPERAAIYLMTGHLDLTFAARQEIESATRGLFMKPLRPAVVRGIILDGHITSDRD